MRGAVIVLATLGLLLLAVQAYQRVGVTAEPEPIEVDVASAPWNMCILGGGHAYFLADTEIGTVSYRGCNLEPR